MLPLIFRCLACSGVVTEWPPLFCTDCNAALITPSRLCSRCGDPSCLPERCHNPWRAWPNSASISAQFLASSTAHPLLRAWKNGGGGKRLRNWLESRVSWDERWNRCKGIVPIPQRLSRSWRLGRNPAREISEVLSKKSGVPIVEILVPDKQVASAAKKLSAEHRALVRRSFSVDTALFTEHEYLIVDDIRTTGRTLRAACAQLSEVKGHALALHVFTLGLRLRHEPPQRQPHSSYSPTIQQ